MFRHCRVAFACRLVLAAIVAILASTSSAFAQFDTATVLGTVRDSTGAVVPGATVTLKNVGTGITANDRHRRRTATTSSSTSAIGTYTRARRAAGLLGGRGGRRRR